MNTSRLRPFVQALVLFTIGSASLPSLAQDLTVQVQKADRKMLAVGESAPAVEVGHWVKGPAFTGFEKGKAYVVEFGATWCGPCRQSIPHLTELQKKHEGKVVITSVHVWESRGGNEPQDSIVAKVTEAYKDINPPIAHRVAVDGPSQAMANNWMLAAGLNSIPQAFVVVVEDTGPKIAWIGHPLSPQFDEIVQKAADGKIDMKEETRKAAEEGVRRARFERTMAMVQQAANAPDGGDRAGALAALDAALKDETDAQYRSSYLRSKFNLLARTDEAAALAMTRGLLEGELKDSEPDLVMFCDLIANGTLKNPDAKLAISLGERANTIAAGKNGRTLHSLAGAYAIDKQWDKAIQTQEAAIAAYKAQFGEGRAAMMATMMQARIDDWKSQAAAKP